MHLVAARIGEGANAVVAERWQYRGDWLHKAYDTRQIFRSDYEHGAFSALHPERFAADAVREGWGVRLVQYLRGKPAARPAPKPKLRAVELVGKLPPDERIRHMRRLQAIGLA